MLQNNSSISIIQYLTNALRTDIPFQIYHSANRGTQKFCQIKNSFREMMNALKRYKINNTFEQRQAFEYKLRKGVKIWKHSEYKLFSWISLWINSNPTPLNQTSQHRNNILQKIFPDKIHFINYQNQIIRLKLSSIRLSWTEKESDFLKILCELQQANSGQGSNYEISWKLISYKLYTEYGILKQPQECRERWYNHINPKLNKNQWTLEQDLQLLNLALLEGNKWAKISKILMNKRSEHMVKNRFKSLKNKYLKKQLDFYKHSHIKKIIRKINNSINSSTGPQQNDLSNTTGQYQKIAAYNIDESTFNLFGFSKIDGSVADKYQMIKSQVEYLKYPLLEPKSNCFIFSQSAHSLLINDDYSWLDQMMERRNMNWLQDSD